LFSSLLASFSRGGILWQLANTGPGVSDTEIKIGNTMPYSGPVSSYGAEGMAEAGYFAMINDQGGINGRKMKFISRDDGYSPPKTVEQVRRLVEEDRVLLLCLNDAAAMLGQRRINDFASALFEHCESTFLVIAHQAAIAGNIGREDGSQPSFDPRHKDRPNPP
jgi:hypothetical protein